MTGSDRFDRALGSPEHGIPVFSAGPSRAVPVARMASQSRKHYVIFGMSLALAACGSESGSGNDTSSGGSSSGGTPSGGTSSGGSSSGGASGASSGGAPSGGGSGGSASGFAPEAGCTATGTPGHGHLFTVSCESGFGEHADFSTDTAIAWQGHEHLGFRFKDFEDGVIQSAGFSVSIAPEQWSLESSVCPANSGECGKRVYLEDERGALEAMQEDTTGKWYATFKMRVSQELQSGKFFRIWGNDKNFWFATGCDDLSLRGSPEYMQGTTVWGSPDQLAPEVWHRVEIVADEAGEVSTYLDGKLQWTEEWITPPFGADGHSIDLGHMLDEPGAFRCAAHPTWDGATFYDDIFYDFTESRFEVSDAAEWDARQAFEVQVPVTWKNESVTIAVNQGAHASLAGKYLFFVSAAGEAKRVGKFE
jgi:hypothetical protein